MREAQFLAAVGVDGIIVQGTEAGGHRGHFMSDHLGDQMDTLSLIRSVGPRVDVPLIAAGGVVDPASVAAAMSAGASGVQVGTAFLRCTEATTSLLHRAAIDEQPERGTAVTNLFTGRPARGIVNRVMREIGEFSDDAPMFPLAAGAMSELRAAAEKKGEMISHPSGAALEFRTKKPRRRLILPANFQPLFNLSLFLTSAAAAISASSEAATIFRFITRQPAST